MLDILETVLDSLNYNYLRLDGQTPVTERYFYLFIYFLIVISIYYCFYYYKLNYNIIYIFIYYN